VHSSISIGRAAIGKFDERKALPAGLTIGRYALEECDDRAAQHDRGGDPDRHADHDEHHVSTAVAPRPGIGCDRAATQSKRLTSPVVNSGVTR
jgi:hypothetical protein